MCHVVVKIDEKVTDPQEKKQIQDKKRLEVLKVHGHAIILFVYTQNKNAGKTLDRFKKKHKKVIEW